MNIGVLEKTQIKDEIKILNRSICCFLEEIDSTYVFYDKQPSGFPHLPDLPGLPPLLVKHNLEAEVIPKLSGSEPIRRPLARIFTLLHFFNLYIHST